MLDWITLTVISRQNKHPCHPLADPLEGDEWRGHQWMAGLLSRLLRGRRG